jgi:5'(3')-deoxyribonucleotidase
MSIKTIILDLDGVMVNFHRAAFSQWHCSPNLVDYDVTCGWHIVDALNAQRDKLGLKRATGTQFWNSFDKGFWANCPKYKYADYFLMKLEKLVGRKNITICTSAAFDSDCGGGKIEWINQNLPSEYRRQYFIGCQKFRLAQPDVLLIDDAEHNVDAFLDAGGRAVLFPRPWNWYKDARSFDPYEYVLEHVEKML